MKLKKGVKRFLIAVVIILVAVLAFFLFKNLDSNQETKEVKVVSKISEYGYTLKDSKTKAYKDMFKDLKEILNDFNENDEIDWRVVNFEIDDIEECCDIEFERSSNIVKITLTPAF